MEKKEEKIRQIILNYLESIEENHSILKGDFLKEEEKNFILSDSNAFLIGLIADQSVKAEIAWSLPFKLTKRLNSKNMLKILDTETKESLTEIIREKPALHRYPNRMATYIYNALENIKKNYNSDASNIWKNESALNIVDRLEKFKGISHKKASLGTLILVRDLGENIEDTNTIDIAYDVHIRRLFVRIGLVENDVEKLILESARRLNPEFPGKLTTAFWTLGREVCRPTDPLCSECPLFNVCEKNGINNTIGEII